MKGKELPGVVLCASLSSEGVPASFVSALFLLTCKRSVFLCFFSLPPSENMVSSHHKYQCLPHTKYMGIYITRHSTSCSTTTERCTLCISSTCLYRHPAFGRDNGHRLQGSYAPSPSFRVPKMLLIGDGHNKQETRRRSLRVGFSSA